MNLIGAPPPWNGLKTAIELSPVCPQNLPSLNNSQNHFTTGRYNQLKRLMKYLQNESEDCLFLNLYVPEWCKYYLFPFHTSTNYLFIYRLFVQLESVLGQFIPYWCSYMENHSNGIVVMRMMDRFYPAMDKLLSSLLTIVLVYLVSIVHSSLSSSSHSTDFLCLLSLLLIQFKDFRCLKVFDIKTPKKHNSI